MSDNIKLVIEIPKDIYARCKEYKLWSYDAETLEGAVATSKPLSEVLDEIKEEIESGGFTDLEGDAYIYVPYAFEIIDNIGKESEGE